MGEPWGLSDAVGFEVELDVLVGHPEHELLFVATQVARAAGLKNPSQASNLGSKLAGHTAARQLGSLTLQETCKKPSGVQKASWLFTESAVYAMLLRGKAPQSEPFRKWVTEEVLPTIRKTKAGLFAKLTFGPLVAGKTISR